MCRYYWDTIVAATVEGRYGAWHGAELSHTLYLPHLTWDTLHHIAWSREWEH